MFSYVLPTRNRPDRLRRTLLAIEALGPHPRGVEILIADNDSDELPILPRALASAIPVRLLRRPTNEGAAARNVAVEASDPSNSWIVMLDDDSYPLDLSFVHALRSAPDDVAAVSADIFLTPPLAPALTTPDPETTTRSCLPRRESGGLPEVFVGCGVALRRDAYRQVGGYDTSFNYYVEEYDLSAKLLLAGYRVAFEPTFRVHHAKDASQRDFNQIIARLVRNNSWIAQRYAPEHERRPMLRETRRRYRQIAEAEEALAGYALGLNELRRTLRAQRRTPMSQDLFDRYTGLAAAREALQSAYAQSGFRTAHLCDVGKNAHIIVQALSELGVRVTSDDEEAEVQVIATMSPGPLLDAIAKRRAMRRPHSPRTIAPWLLPAAQLRLDTSGLAGSVRPSPSRARTAVRRAG
jgi:GT2 family glycosyltransferase